MTFRFSESPQRDTFRYTEVLLQSVASVGTLYHTIPSWKPFPVHPDSFYLLILPHFPYYLWLADCSCRANLLYFPIFDSQIYQNTAESLILPGFFSGAFSFYYIVFFLNQIWMIDFYDFSRDCLLSFWISFIFLLVRNS